MNSLFLTVTDSYYLVDEPYTLMTMRLKQKYNDEIASKLKAEFNLENVMAIPRLEKVVINVGLGEAKDNKALLEKVEQNITALAGQKVVITRAKGAISGFKISKGDPIGVMVTLRGDRMYAFLDKLINIVLPKVRDFRGLPANAFDLKGNYNLGLREQAIFPEVTFQGSGADRARGMQIVIVTSSQTKEQGKRLLELLGMPFKEN